MEPDKQYQDEIEFFKKMVKNVLTGDKPIADLNNVYPSMVLIKHSKELKDLYLENFDFLVNFFMKYCKTHEWVKFFGSLSLERLVRLINNNYYCHYTAFENFIQGYVRENPKDDTLFSIAEYISEHRQDYADNLLVILQCYLPIPFIQENIGEICFEPDELIQHQKLTVEFVKETESFFDWDKNSLIAHHRTNEFYRAFPDVFKNKFPNYEFPITFEMLVENGNNIKDLRKIIYISPSITIRMLVDFVLREPDTIPKLTQLLTKQNPFDALFHTAAKKMNVDDYKYFRKHFKDTDFICLLNDTWNNILMFVQENRDEFKWSNIFFFEGCFINSEPLTFDIIKRIYDIGVEESFNWATLLQLQYDNYFEIVNWMMKNNLFLDFEDLNLPEQFFRVEILNLLSPKHRLTLHREYNLYKFFPHFQINIVSSEDGDDVQFICPIEEIRLIKVSGFIGSEHDCNFISGQQHDDPELYSSHDCDF